MLAGAGMVWGQPPADPRKINGTRDALPLPKNIGEVADWAPPQDFETYRGAVLGQRFRIGNATPRGLYYVMDVLPQEHDATGVYQLVTNQAQVWQLVTERGTLASRAALDIAGCSPRLTLSDATGPFATIEIRRGWISSALMTQGFYGWDSASPTVYLSVTQRAGAAQQWRRRISEPISFSVVGAGLVPPSFYTFDGAGDEALRIDLIDQHKIEVRYTKPKARRGRETPSLFDDDRTMTNLAYFAANLQGLMSLEMVARAEKARKGCT